ncbi:glycosyltransferase [Haloarcula halophila]|uniref:glycosyltransferase n=1 Tax=Haloarcula TaxID=2237 RepID=UPI0023E44973|nr:glycosyltransferase [Halomicroarcula sp. DFY41]
MLNYEFPPLGGGAANANQYLLQKFANRHNLYVDLITSSASNEKIIQFAENITIHKLDVEKQDIHHWTQIEILRYSWQAFQRARKLIKKNEYDVVHAWFGVPSGVLARVIDIPFLVALRGSDVPGYNERFTAQYTLLRPIIRHVWQEAEAVVANSEGLRELARETATPGIEVIPNGVAISEFTPEYPRSGRLSVLCVARLVERKGIKYLIDAISCVSETELTVVGEGERESELKNCVERLGITDRVNFTGYVPHDEIHEYYERADVFVLPSFNEGMSNTVLEAMAAGLPIVTTNTGGTAELLDGNGVIVEKRSSDAIKDALQEYMRNEEKRESDGRRSRKLAENMSWETVADQYYSLYKQIC